MELKISEKEREILALMDREGRRSYSKIAKKAGVSRQRFLYYVKKLKQAGIYRSTIGFIDLSMAGFSYYRLHLKLQFASKEAENSVCRFICSKKRVIWLAQCDGRFDLMVGYAAPSAREFSAFIDELLDEFGKNIQAYEFVQVLEAPALSRTFEAKGIKQQRKGFWSGPAEPIQIDKADEKILNALCKDMHVRVLDLSRQTGVSPISISTRITKLVKERMIMSYAQVSYDKLGMQLYKVLFYFSNLSPKRREELIKFAKGQGAYMDILTCLGPWQLELDVETKNIDECRQLVYKIKDTFSDVVRNHETLHVLEEKKFSFDVFDA